MRKFWIIWLAGGALASTSVEAKGPIELNRVGKWNVNYDEDSCHLTGVFGEGARQIIVRLTRFQPADLFTLELYGAPVRTSEPYSDLRVDFGPVENPHRVRTMNGKAGKIPFSNLGSLRLDDLHESDSGTVPPYGTSAQRQDLPAQPGFNAGDDGRNAQMRRQSGAPLGLRSGGTERSPTTAHSAQEPSDLAAVIRLSV
jgi:hypothetical protein